MKEKKGQFYPFFIRPTKVLMIDELPIYIIKKKTHMDKAHIMLYSAILLDSICILISRLSRYFI